MLTVGIDPHKNMHQAIALADNGTRLGPAKKVESGPQALGKLLARDAGRTRGRTPQLTARKVPEPCPCLPKTLR
jgi:hypothetical protein